ncbi:AMP-binding protein [Rugamonas sp.]|uniref:AMP-binding protein n=1 Tax=Rugamonas sp. TaxID=1926287 RepID=UPI0025F389D6|nr:AMP-binding protein [Rugamonas sp.]
MHTEFESVISNYCADSIELDTQTRYCRVLKDAGAYASNGGAHGAAPLGTVDHPVLSTFTLQRRFEVLAQTNPGAAAIKSGAIKLTYGELDAQADGLAVLLQRRGVRSGSVVAVCMAPSISLPRAVLAVLKAGAACLMLDPAQKTAQLSAALREREAMLVLTAADATPLSIQPAQEIRCTEDGGGLPFAWPDEYPTHRLSPAYAQRNHPDGPGAGFGSHLSVTEQLLAIQSMSPIRPGEAVMQCSEATPTAFPWGVVWALSYGATVLIAAPGETADAYYLRQLILREHITAMPAVPALLALLERASEYGDLGPLRTLFCAHACAPGRGLVPGGILAGVDNHCHSN